MSGIQSMGIVNSLKTGNVVLDMTFAMIIPMVLGIVLGWVASIQRKLGEIDWMMYFQNNDVSYTRIIRHSKMTSTY
eukprot:CAMPEP_0194101090 /NCGR_PEP_ID=MMETSP0150-20130528/1821_1 /TAXON_ID=122233 /ORGANISM="Chaetoceros debilis, Strain MM31A-1" /LENGTH=75 /DNA_ID=CAMNT_0038787585 /DNA_START=32 /DNA_END=256 /DNA_ORIENTATION=-